MILDAECFKASVVQPPPGKDVINSGNTEQQIEQLLKQIRDNQDDEYYQVTSHVDQKLKLHIQKGEYIELESLIPKSRGANVKRGW